MAIRTASELKILSVWPSPPPLYLYNFRLALKRAWKDCFGKICQECNKEMDFKTPESRNYATIDHIKARSLGGNDDLGNIQVICKKCNNEKSKEEYYQAQ